MAFSNETIYSVWQKGKPVSGYDPKKYRQDECSAWMQWEEYGNRESDFGWEIDHIKPAASGGSDGLTNLRPLQWENNAARQSGRLVCRVRSQGEHNVRTTTNNRP